MDDSPSSSLQIGLPTTNTTANGTNTTVAIDGTGPIGEALHQFGLDTAYAKPLGAAISFVVAFVVIYLFGRAVLIPLFNRTLDRWGFDDHEKRPLLRILHLIMRVVALAVAFKAARLTGFFASTAVIAAAATLAVGLALQDTLSNVVAGVFIYTGDLFTIGDWIEWDKGAYTGIVEDISFRVTRVRTFDNELLTVPNSTLTDDVIKNTGAKDELRIQFDFRISYNDDIDEAAEIIVEEAKRHPDILDDPAPSVRMAEPSEPGRGALADFYVGLTSRFWIANPTRNDFLKTRGEYITSVKNRFDDAGIDIPYPQIHLVNQCGENPVLRLESNG